MPYPEFEYLLAEHCAPTLLSHKCASLVRLSSRSFPDLSFLQLYREALGRLGVACRIICSCQKHRLLLLYRPAQLAAQLQKPGAAELLQSCGYPSGASLEELLAHLETRFSCTCGAFPHEIGLFLGYPVPDVRGFMQNSGSGFLFCGYWKVYAEPEAARKRFALYDRCRSVLFRHLRAGKSISALRPAA